jgi:unsaturated rhamnogalacturonyl hydrolase
LLAVFEKTKENKYRAAADTLREQLRGQPRTHEGGFWHKKIYPYQMWLDGLFMAEPFYAAYAKVFNEPKDFDDITNQFIWIAHHTRDPKTGLFYHGWDESKQQKWADSVTGCSPCLWGRALGWYAMGLVDVLDYVPVDHPQRKELITILQGLADALLRVRDQNTSLWYQVVDQGGKGGNYLESSSSSMFAYAFAKGANKGYLDAKFFAAAEESFNGVIKYRVTIDDSGFVDLHQTCAGVGLGGNPYRDGSFEYYVGAPQRTNDMKGIGPFLRAAIELEKGRERSSPVRSQ